MSHPTPQAVPELSPLIARCESEELHRSGAIQPQGALLLLSRDSRRVTHASANLDAITGVAASDVLGRRADEVPALARLDLDGAAPLPVAAASGLPQRWHVVFEAGRRALDCTAIASTGSVLLEIEPASATSVPRGLVESLMQGAPSPRRELGEYHAWLLDALRQLTSFDRFMIYRFHDDWSGEVIAEWSQPDLEPFLGLRYPASDIPEIARKLYLQNACRSIPDVSAMPVAMLGGDTPDLTHSDLRSVSPVHLQYLKNMQVAASFSIPIRSVRGLWGLVSCHHRRPYRLSRPQRDACVTLAHGYSMRLMSTLSARTLQETDAAERRARSLFEQLRSEPDPFAAVLASEPTLSALVAARGVAIGERDRLASAGVAPDRERLDRLDAWFSQRPELMLQNEHWTSFLAVDGAADAVRGFLAVKARYRSGWLRFYWFRPEEVQEIAWGGQPEKVVDQATGALSPRSSFSRWVEVRQGHSQPWTVPQQIMAGKVRQCLAEWQGSELPKQE
ncbi:MAG TPA: GAF domain-containing protein [Polyangiaceae bacterium]|nr:GAF domain-containing protein [Polyangiaceae bacterium]